MKVIDARSGKELHEGDQIPFSSTKRIVEIHANSLTAYAVMMEDGREYVQPLILRYAHPNFLGQKVAFYPS